MASEGPATERATPASPAAPRRRTGVVLMVVLVVLVATTGGALALGKLPGLMDPAPRMAADFTIQVQDGNSFSLSEHRGSVVVVDLMAVDCQSCRITEQALLALRASSPETVIVSVDIWTSLEDRAYLEAHMEALGADWSYGMDTDGLLQKYDAFEISKVIVVDPQGHIAWSRVGGIRAGPLAAAVDDAWRSEREAAPIVPTLDMGVHGFAALAGVAAFFAPCAFPLLPGYMAYTVSLRNGHRSHPVQTTRPDGPSTPADPAWHRGLAPGLAAALGVFSVYVAVGLVVSAFGGAASRYVPLLQPLAGISAIVLGLLLLLGVSMARIVAPVRRAVDHAVSRLRGRRPGRPGDLTAFYSYGLGYGAASAACTAPIFLQLVITAFAVDAGTGLRVFLVYAAAASTLMVAATLLSLGSAGWLRGRAATFSRVIVPATGIIMIGAGVYLVGFYARAFGGSF